MTQEPVAIRIHRFQKKPRLVLALGLAGVALFLVWRLFAEAKTLNPMNILFSVFMAAMYTWWAFSTYRGARFSFEADANSIRMKQDNYGFDIPFARVNRIDFAPESIRIMHHDCHHHVVLRSWFTNHEWQEVNAKLQPLAQMLHT